MNCGIVQVRVQMAILRRKIWPVAVSSHWFIAQLSLLLKNLRGLSGWNSQTLPGHAVTDSKCSKEQVL